MVSNLIRLTSAGAYCAQNVPDIKNERYAFYPLGSISAVSFNTDISCYFIKGAPQI